MKNENKSAANVRQIRDTSATKKAKTRKVSPTKTPNANKSAAELQQIRYAFAPILQQFRSHTRKNEARLWLPVETNLISRYEFAALSPQNRYIFVAILLYMAGNGIDEIPLDAKFMGNVLVVDERMLRNSFEELLFANLLQERKERIEKNREEQTDRQEEIAPDARVCVDVENSFSESNQDAKRENKNGLLKIVPSGNGNSLKKNLSKFSIEECMKYVELCKLDGESIQSPRALANHLHKTGEADSLIFCKLFPKEAEQFAAQKFGKPIKFLDEPCVVCFGAKLADTDGKGARACRHCVNERGRATGKEPKGE